MVDTTRRAFLRDSAALPIAGATVLYGATIAHSYSQGWEDAKADVARAWADMRAAERHYGKGNMPDAAAEPLGDRISDAEWRLIEHPAPDTDALLHKLRLMVEDSNYLNKGWPEAVLADAERLLGKAVRNG